MSSRQCRHCSMVFRPSREDHYFCSGKCVAAYYRLHPNPEDIHADLPRDIPCVCDTCGSPFDINAYADRSGQRVPKFCSSKCRQKAYRDRNGVSENRDHHTRQAPPPPPPPRPNRPPVTDNWARARSLLGLGEHFSKDDLKAAYRAQIKLFHPDINKAQDATRKAQEINWAFNYLRRI